MYYFSKNFFKVTLIFTALTCANASNSQESDDFKSFLDSVSDIATRNLSNVDYLPSVVTVVKAQTFKNAGIQTIAEALDMLPGFQMQLSPVGLIMTTVRGLKNPNSYLSDKVKVLIDGVAINNEVIGSSHFYLDFPIQLVDKIEVLRGPNSAIYGAGSFYGTINIVTKLGKNTKENQLFLGAGSYQYGIAGINFNASLGNWDIFTDGYYKLNDKALDVKNETRKTDEAMKDFSIGIKAINGGFEFITRLKRNDYENFYSFEGLLNPIEQRDEGHINTYFLSQLSYKTDLNNYKLETKASFSHRGYEMKSNSANVKDIANFFSVVDIDMQDGFYTHDKSKEKNLEAEMILTFPKIKSNNILAGAGIRQADITHDEFYSSVEDTITKNRDTILAHANYDEFRYRQDKESAFWANPTTTLLPNDTKRTIRYGYLQDLIEVNENLDLVLGLRADSYSDYDLQINKRAALVYRMANESVILKLLYGSAFRVPTLIEAYHNGHINTRAGDSTIQPEETDTYEIVGIYKPNYNHKFSLNLFRSELEDIIDLEQLPYTDPGYRNYKERNSQGIEFEYFFHTATKHNLYFNATYLDTIYTLPPEPAIKDFVGSGVSVATASDGGVDVSMPDISEIMLKAMYVYTPTQDLSFGINWKYFSETTKTELSWVKNDSTVDDAHILDTTVTYRLSSSSELQFTVKNLLDEDVNMPSYYYQVDGGILREGRNYFLNYTLRF